tara:strand:- start:2129 stop:2527 length:399 start_codon:yes stop_codon:yes gene_type:complete
MAKKYENFSIGENLYKENEGYSAWTNDLLRKLVAGKTVIKPEGSTGGHRLIESEVVYVFLSGIGQMEVIEYANHEAGHGTNPSFGIEHKAELAIVSGDIVLAEEGDYIKVKNSSTHEQLTYLRIFDSEGARK